MLKWPQRALGALRKLFEPLQEIDVYVEDTKDEPFYGCLIKHATQGRVQIARVFGLGGRVAVMRAARNYDQSKRRALFIIDGDLPWVRGEAVDPIIGLHRHDAYCVENLLLCERAVIALVSQELIVTEEDAERGLSYALWRASIVEPLADLFAAFAVAHEVSPSVPTVSTGLSAICDWCKRGRINRIEMAKVATVRESVLNAAAAEARGSDVRTRHSEIFTRIMSLPEPLLAPSGKDYLLPLLDFHLRSLGCSIKRKSLRLRLAGSGNLDRFSDLASALIHAARGSL